MRFWALLLIVVISAVFPALPVDGGDAGSSESNVSIVYPPLRLSEPVEDIVADLEDYIPERMGQDDVPGLSIALVRDGEVVWAAGFGVSSSITRNPVTPGTVFEVASISKVVTSYVALRLVEQGEFSLDKPVTSFLSEPWLPPSEYGDRITLRHLASHSSGLTDGILLTERKVAFEPGSEFRYSGVGAMYMQRVVEQATGRSLEDAAKELVFEPLGMVSSSFANTGVVRPNLANGHITYVVPLLVFLGPFTLVLLGIGVVGLTALRIAKGGWCPTRKMVIGTFVLAAVLTFSILLYLLRSVLVNLVLMAALCAAIFVLAFTSLFFVGRRMVGFLPAGWRGSKRRLVLLVTRMVLVTVVLFWFAGLVTGPIPKSIFPQASAVGSLRTTATDLATFLIELAEPQYLGDDIAEQIRTSQVRVDPDFSWGLGPGIQHSEYGDALWQNGNTPGFRSVMVIYPTQRIGVVVLTNSDRGQAAAYDIAQRALGGKSRWGSVFP